MTYGTVAGNGSGGATAADGPALVVDQLDVTYRVRGRDRLALRNVSFEIGRTESYGLVGESGSGKSTVALALPGTCRATAASAPGRSASTARRAEPARGRAARPARPHGFHGLSGAGRALNPSIEVGRQVAEVYEVAGLSRDEAMDRAAEMLAKVQIPDPAG